MEIFRIGWMVAVLLAAFTGAEYVFAAEVNETGIRVAGVMVAGGLKAALIGWFFMHLARVWRGEEAH